MAMHDNQTVIERIRDITTAAIEQKKKMAHARAEKKYHDIVMDIEKAARDANFFIEVELPLAGFYDFGEKEYQKVLKEKLIKDGFTLNREKQTSSHYRFFVGW